MSDIMIDAETRLNEMIADIGETTGKQHPTLNDGVQELKKGYGQGGTEELEAIIDESGLLYKIAETATEKVETLVHLAEVLKSSKKLYFANTNITHIDFYIDWVSVIDFANTKKLEYIEGFDLTKVVDVRYCFEYSAIKSIHQPLNFSNTTAYYSSNMFVGATNLEHILIVEETIKESLRFVSCSKLSNESKQSIFDGLAFVTTAQTVTFHKDVKLLQSQVDSANAKGWTVAGGTVVSEEEYYG